MRMSKETNEKEAKEEKEKVAGKAEMVGANKRENGRREAKEEKDSRWEGGNGGCE